MFAERQRDVRVFWKTELIWTWQSHAIRESVSAWAMAWSAKQLSRGGRTRAGHNVLEWCSQKIHSVNEAIHGVYSYFVMEQLWIRSI